MEARNRNLKDWYGKILRGEIKLPRFQRHEAWDKHRISNLIETVVHDLPLGITLTLEVGDKEQFISRFLETATPKEKQRVLEHLLDGQQRLTALWRAFHNNYERETYFIHLEEFDEYGSAQDQPDMAVFCRTRYTKSNGEKYPLWCDDPSECLRRGYIPTHLLKPEDIQQEIDEWLDKATATREPEGGKEELKAFYDFQKRVSDGIKDLRSIIANYNLPYLSLPSDTDKSVALDVFIKMNTNSKPLTQYDVIVAEVESVMGSSLHELQNALDNKYPDISRYGELPDLILTTSALLQDELPNQRGSWDMDKQVMVQKWEIMENGLQRMAEFLRNEGIYDRKRLPTNAVLAVIASLYSNIPTHGDKRGKDELLLKKYLWYSFFTDRYENAAATRAFSDFIALKRVINQDAKEDGSAYSENDIPVFTEHELVHEEELLTAEWPKRTTIRGRAVLAVACRLGASDFSTGEKLDAENVEQRHYHHLYPDALLKEVDINSYLALNCALISDMTNLTIGRKDPVKYLKDRYQWTSEEIVEERLHSHLIPVPELANGGYEGLPDVEKKDKLSSDFEKFLQKRATLVMQAVRLLAEGRQLSASVLFKE
ncbi:GmrSD restriction endonuclease domain-containing protein [Desulfoferula mesophila]|uniref:GmrSD restriction endonucleases N-terminal domain-containing protein n=1 Tax=Desulfoferula mesophila TaxID=3058419 RepID=A0AAU9EGA0_9BACT|nr:hypothetical protein FAK_32520 [Desulfoferula mesophilus]